MPYYSELGLTSTPSSSAYASLLLSGPYSNHSSIIASNYTPFSKPTSRQIRSGFKPHLTTISEFNSPLRRINSPPFSTRPYGPTIKTINTADIDVSTNRYKKFERPKTDSVERKKEIERPKIIEKPKNLTKTSSPRRSVEEQDAKPNKEIKRDRATIRFQTIHKDTLKDEIGEIKSWRDNFKPEELRDKDGEAKRRKKTPGEILMEKFLIRSKSKENLTKGKSIKRKRVSVKRSPSFRDICQAITSETIDQELNPGQPEEVQRRQSRQIGGETILREIRRASTDLSEEDIKILDTIIAKQEKMNECPENEQFEPRESVRKKRLSKKRSVKENGTGLHKSLSKESILETESKSPLKRRSTLKKVKKTVSNSSDSSEVESLIADINKNIVRDISQVDIEQKKFKPKPVITASVGDIESTKPTLKAVVDDVEVEESPKKFPDKKFKFNVIVEVDENDSKLKKKPPITAPKMRVSDDNKIKVLKPQAKEPIITNVLKKRPLAENGFILNEKHKNDAKKQIIETNIIQGKQDEISAEKQSSPFSKFNDITKKDNNSAPDLSSKMQTSLSKTNSATNAFQKEEPMSPVSKTKFQLTKSNSSSPKSTLKKSEINCDISPGIKAVNGVASTPGSPLKKYGNFFQENKTEFLQNIDKENLKLQIETSKNKKDETGQNTKSWFEQDSSIPSTPIYSNKNIFNKENKRENVENMIQGNNVMNGTDKTTPSIHSNNNVFNILEKVDNEETKKNSLEKLKTSTGENYTDAKDIKNIPEKLKILTEENNKPAESKPKAWFEKDSSVPSTPIYSNKNLFSKIGKNDNKEEIKIPEKIKISTEEINKAVDSKATAEKVPSTPVFSNNNIFNKVEKPENKNEKKVPEKLKILTEENSKVPENKTKAWFEQDSSPSTPVFSNKYTFNKGEKIENKEEKKVPQNIEIFGKENTKVAENKIKTWFENDSSGPSTPVFNNKNTFNKLEKENEKIIPKVSNKNEEEIQLKIKTSDAISSTTGVKLKHEEEKQPEKLVQKNKDLEKGQQKLTQISDNKNDGDKTENKEAVENKVKSTNKGTNLNSPKNCDLKPDNIKIVPLKDSNDVPNVEKIKKLISKRSLVKNANKDDPDLEVFEPPEPGSETDLDPTSKLEPEPDPEEKENKDAFVPLQSNDFCMTFMHPWKKPEQLDVCPVEIFARPKTIRGRHYPRPKGHPAPSEEESSSEEESDESDESDTSSEEENSSSEEDCDSGFGSKDKDCDVNIHKKCEKLTANLCGVNQKLVVEAIESVRKGSSESRDSPTSNHANNPAFALDSGDLPLECSQSSTYASFQKSGRITPPATTIPRFRKYCVDDFNFLKVLGKGSFGKVLLAELKGTEYYYAVKCLKKDVVLEDDDVECTLIERKVLALGTKHPYLCHLLCTFQTESHLFFVMEYLNGGDLMFHIQASGRFPEHQARFYGAEIVSGLKFLHNKGIVYRDLKLDNVLLDFDGHVRIADFGMCKLQIFLDRMAETFCGTPDYMAPEIIKGLHYNQGVDWWSFGVLLYEMLLGQSPFSGCDEDELFWSICNEKPVLPRYLSTEATNILTQLLEKDATKRLGNRFSPHGDIQDHVFFRLIDWRLLETRQMDPPFKPFLQHPLDTKYFDKHFTIEKAKITPTDPTILHSMDQTQFQGFSYTNPNATDK